MAMKGFRGGSGDVTLVHYRAVSAEPAHCWMAFWGSRNKGCWELVGVISFPPPAGRALLGNSQGQKACKNLCPNPALVHLSLWEINPEPQG
jgi:hypothetical protein